MITWRHTAALGLLSILLSGACTPKPARGPGPRGTLRFIGEPKDARLEVDETSLGPIGLFEKKGLLLRPGTHRVIVRAEGYFPAYKLVDIENKKIVVLRITLRPIPE